MVQTAIIIIRKFYAMLHNIAIDIVYIMTEVESTGQSLYYWNRTDSWTGRVTGGVKSGIHSTDCGMGQTAG